MHIPKPRKLTKRMRRPLAELIDRLRHGYGRRQDRDEPASTVRMRRLFAPSIRSLEPRFVLNASAELSALGQLLVSGDDFANTVRLEVDAAGQVSLTDEMDQVIPIAGHPTDPLSPLAVSAIPSSQIVFQLGGGDDHLTLQVPLGVDLTVADGAGIDEVHLSPVDRGGSESTNTIRIESETIRFDPNASFDGANQIVFKNDLIQLQGNVVFGSAVGSSFVNLVSSDVEFDGNVRFIGDTRFHAEQVSFAGEVDVASLTRLETVVVDSVSAITNLSKTGDGTLVLSESNLYSGTTEVREGVLRVDGDIQSDADVTVFSQASLEGRGTIAGQLVVQPNGTVSPGVDATTNATDELRVGSLNLAPSSVLAMQVDGSQADQVVVASNSLGQVSIGQAILDLSVVGDIGPATEFVLIDNDGTDPVTGNLRVLFDVDGSPLPQGRTLVDGAVVLNSFGAMGQSAAITYAGGDGNDVAIVTFGGFDFSSEGVTLVSQSGVNLELRTGTDLSAATVATPVIRPIVGLDGETVRIIGSANNDRVVIDVDRFINGPPGAIPFQGVIEFIGDESTTDNDRIELFDSNALGDPAGSVRYQSIDNENGVISVASQSGLDAFEVRYRQTESIVQSFLSQEIELQFAGRNDQVRFSIDPSDSNRTLANTVSDGQTSTSVSFRSPLQLLDIRLADGDDSLFVDSMANDFDAELRIDGQAGNDAIETNADLTLGGAATGSLTLDAETLRINGDVDTTGGQTDGEIQLRAIDGVTITSTLVTGGGAITIDGGGGRIDIATGSVVADAVNDPIRISNASNVVLGDFDAPRGTLEVGRNGTVAGDITQAAGTGLRIGTLRSDAGGSIDLFSDVNRIGLIEDLNAIDSVRIRSSGDELRVDSIVSQMGNIVIDNSFGTVDLRAVNAQAGSIDVVANGATSDVLAGNLVAGDDGDIRLVAGDDVLMNSEVAGAIILADDLQVVAANQSGDQDVAIQLVTNVNDFAAEVRGTARGDISVDEFDSLRLASSDTETDAEVLQTANGEINIQAAGSIEVVDFDPSNENALLSADREIIADGENGRISLLAGESLVIGDSVQLSASRSTIAAVILQSAGIEFGENVEINTGEGVGVARSFAPRPETRIAVDPDDPSMLVPPEPMVGPSDSAFFDPNSVTTSTLTQANLNDSTGVLTFDIGQSGERGLTVNIDWGTETLRFQQIDNISADDALFVTSGSDTPQVIDGDPLLNVEHFYPEEDVLSSRLNDRSSETQPINVRFSVRHHESIVVLANSVLQANGVTEAVASGVVSATDNDNPLDSLSFESLTLDNGIAAFIIPPLSIPVAFFPVRDVVPEIEEPEVFVRQESNVFLPQNSLQTTDASSSSTTVREEYLQIRMLSPEPGAEDLAPAERLPDDILDGDKLQRLFSQLPDGRYEIEYVLGDGNERLILRVDLRDGNAIIPGDDLEGGTLRLTPLDEANDEAESDAIDLDERTDEETDMSSDETALDATVAIAAFPIVVHAAGIKRKRRKGAAGRFSNSSRLIDRIAKKIAHSSTSNEGTTSNEAW